MSTGAAPIIDPASQSVGPMSLGDRIDAAEAFGRPLRVHGSMKDGDMTLDYPGFELQFKRARWIDFEREGATLALEFTGGELTCVQLYAEGYA